MRAPADHPPLQLAIVGCGAVAELLYARVLPRVEEVRARLVCDLDTSAAASLARRIGAEPAPLDRIIAEAEAVVVATPPGTHAELVGRLLRRGRVILCEKPFVPTLEEAAALVDAASTGQSRLCVGHFRRAYPSVALARELLATNAHGGLKRIAISEGGRFDWPSHSGYASSDPLGGVLLDTGSHSLDMALYAARLDEVPLRVRVAALRRERPEPAHEIDATFSLESASGEVEVRLRLSRYEQLANSIRFEMERGTLEIPTAPRNAARLSGSGTSALVCRPGGERSQLDSLAEQWRGVFSKDGDERFAARRFLALTSVLEALRAS